MQNLDNGPGNTPRRWPRRTFLVGIGAVTVGASTAGKTVTAYASGARGGAGSAQPVDESGWKIKQPPLTTPWTSQVSPTKARPEYPRPQLVRQQWASLNGVWQFSPRDPDQPGQPGQDLPERILVPYPVESALSGIMRHESSMVYRRRFLVPSSWNVNARSGNRLLLHFDGVDYQATVTVNGHRLTTHQGGYDRFSVDATDALHTGPDGTPVGTHELLVEVDDPTEDGIQPLGKQRVAAIDPTAPHSALYYTPASGIWQPVWMEPVPLTHISDIVVEPDLTAQAARIMVNTSSACTVAIAVEHAGSSVGRSSGPSGHPITVPIPDPTPWTPDNPFLYDVIVEVRDQSAHDTVRGYFAMREISIGSVNGTPHMLLNGEYVTQLSSLQQGFWPDGIYSAATDEALRFDVEQAKSLGFNTIRKHQKVEPDRWYYYADTLGMLVWQDMPATATGRQPPNQKVPSSPPDDGKAEFERELQRIIEQKRAFGSIVMWIPFNEGWGAYDLARIGNEIRSWDPTRLVDEMSGTTTANYDEGGGDVLDWHNLGSHFPGPVPPAEGNRAAIIAEFGAFGYPVAGHEWSPGHSKANQKVSGAAELTDDYVTALENVANFVATQNLSAASYNLFEDAELQVNGLFTYDRRVFKADDRARVIAANQAVIAAGNRLTESSSNSPRRHPRAAS